MLHRLLPNHYLLVSIKQASNGEFYKILFILFLKYASMLLRNALLCVCVCVSLRFFSPFLTSLHQVRKKNPCLQKLQVILIYIIIYIYYHLGSSTELVESFLM